jgi:hypothetical protein
VQEVLEAPKKFKDSEYSWERLLPSGSPHPELDSGYAVNLEAQDPINRCSCWKYNQATGELERRDLKDALADARAVRALSPLQRDAEIRRWRRLQ